MSKLLLGSDILSELFKRKSDQLDARGGSPTFSRFRDEEGILHLYQGVGQQVGSVARRGRTVGVYARVATPA